MENKGIWEVSLQKMQCALKFFQLANVFLHRGIPEVILNNFHSQIKYDMFTSKYADK